MRLRILENGILLIKHICNYVKFIFMYCKFVLRDEHIEPFVCLLIYISSSISALIRAKVFISKLS